MEKWGEVWSREKWGEIGKIVEKWGEAGKSVEKSGEMGRSVEKGEMRRNMEKCGEEWRNGEKEKQGRVSNHPYLQSVSRSYTAYRSLAPGFSRVYYPSRASDWSQFPGATTRTNDGHRTGMTFP